MPPDAQSFCRAAGGGGWGAGGGRRRQPLTDNPLSSPVAQRPGLYLTFTLCNRSGTPHQRFALSGDLLVLRCPIYAAPFLLWPPVLCSGHVCRGSRSCSPRTCCDPVHWHVGRCHIWTTALSVVLHAFIAWGAFKTSWGMWCASGRTRGGRLNPPFTTGSEYRARLETAGVREGAEKGAKHLRSEMVWCGVCGEGGARGVVRSH